MFAEVLRDEMPYCLRIPFKWSAKGCKNAHSNANQANMSKCQQLILCSGHTGFTISWEKKDWAEIKNLTEKVENKV